MAKKKGGSSKRGFTIPIAVVGGFMGSGAIQGAIADGMAGNFKGVTQDLGALVGMSTDGKFYADVLFHNMTPIAVGMAIHLIASKLGVNRVLGRMGVPIIRI